VIKWNTSKPSFKKGVRLCFCAPETAPSFAMQRILLEQEGIVFKPNGCVDMKRFI